MWSEQHEGEQNNERISMFFYSSLGTEIRVSAMKITMVQTLDRALYGLTRPDHRADIKCVLV